MILQMVKKCFQQEEGSNIVNTDAHRCRNWRGLDMTPAPDTTPRHAESTELISRHKSHTNIFVQTSTSSPHRCLCSEVGTQVRQQRGIKRRQTVCCSTCIQEVKISDELRTNITHNKRRKWTVLILIIRFCTVHIWYQRCVDMNIIATWY